MKSIISFLICYFLITGTVHASMIEDYQTDNILGDSETGLNWYSDPYYFKGKNRTEILFLVDTFSVITTNGILFDDWRLATFSEVRSLFWSGTFFDYFSGIQSVTGHIFDDPNGSPSGEHTVVTNHSIGAPGTISDCSEIGAFIVTSETPTLITMPTPEPATALLFGTGFVGLTWIGRRQKQ